MVAVGGFKKWDIKIRRTVAETSPEENATLPHLPPCFLKQGGRCAASGGSVGNDIIVYIINFRMLSLLFCYSHCCGLCHTAILSYFQDVLCYLVG